MTIKDKKVNYPVARAHKVIHAAPQFRPIQKGARRKGLERVYECKNGDKITIAIFSELDIADQDLLLCLLAIARSPRGGIVSPSPKTERGQALRVALDLKGYAETQDAIMFNIHAHELLVELGRAHGKSGYEWLHKSLIRLSRVSFVYDGKLAGWTFNLLSVSWLKDDIGRLTELSICINPLSARAVLANTYGGYVLMHRGERSMLKTEEARALHSVLCGLVDSGKDRIIAIDTLSDRVYSRYDEDVSDDVVRYRRSRMVVAAAEINELEYWSCQSEGRGERATLCVSRKKAKFCAG